MTLASVINPKEYNTLDILHIKHLMPSCIKNLVLDRDYTAMTGSATGWKALWEYFELSSFTDFQTLLNLPPSAFQEVIEKEYDFTLASVIHPKEYDTLDIIYIEHCMPRYIKYLVLVRDYAEMTSSPTSWKALWEYFEN